MTLKTQTRQNEQLTLVHSKVHSGFVFSSARCSITLQHTDSTLNRASRPEHTAVMRRNDGRAGGIALLALVFALLSLLQSLQPFESHFDSSLSTSPHSLFASPRSTWTLCSAVRRTGLSASDLKSLEKEWLDDDDAGQSILLISASHCCVDVFSLLPQSRNAHEKSSSCDASVSTRNSQFVACRIAIILIYIVQPLRRLILQEPKLPRRRVQRVRWRL